MKNIIGIILLSLFMLSFIKQGTDIPTLWSRFDSWLAKHASHLKKELNTAATRADIERLEKAIGTTLPKDYVDFLMIHNGQKSDTEGLIETEELLSVDRIIEEWQVWKELLDGGDFDGNKAEPQSGIKNDWWNPKWIPVTYDGNGNHYCIDLDPASGGTNGQIIRVWHDSGDRKLVAVSFKKWMSDYVSGLEKGKYVYSKDSGGIIDKDDL